MTIILRQIKEITLQGVSSKFDLKNISLGIGKPHIIDLKTTSDVSVFFYQKVYFSSFNDNNITSNQGEFLTGGLINTTFRGTIWTVITHLGIVEYCVRACEVMMHNHQYLINLFLNRPPSCVAISCILKNTDQCKKCWLDKMVSHCDIINIRA